MRRAIGEIKDRCLRHRFFLAGAVLVAALVVIVTANLIVTPGTIMYGDLATPRDLNRYELYPLWTQYGSYSNLDKVDRLLGFGVPIDLAQLLSVPTEAFIKMMIVGNLLIAGLAMYIAAYWMGRRHFPATGRPALALIAFCAATVYMFNPWSMNRIEHYFLWTGYALAPLILVGALKGMEDRDLGVLMGTGLLWTVASTSVQYTMFLGLIVLGVFVYQQVRRTTWAERWATTRSFLILFSVFLITSLYWIVPYVLSFGSGVEGPSTVLTVEVVKMLSQNSDPVNAIRGIGYWWPRVDYVAQGGLEPLWQVTSVIVPVLAYGALLFRRDRFTLFLVALGSFFLFLSMGTNWALGGVYEWLAFQAPLSGQLGWVLRDPDKWAGPMMMAFSLLLVITLLGLTERLRKRSPWSSTRRGELFAAGAVVLLVLSGFAVFAGPSANEYLNDIYHPVQVPSEYFTTGDWLAAQQGDFNVMWLPNSPGLPTTWTNKWVANIDNMYSGKPDIGGNTLYASFYRSFLNETLALNQTDHFGRFLSAAGIKYLIVREDVPSLDPLVQEMMAAIPWQKDLTMVREDGELRVYEVTEPMATVYATNNLISVLGGLDDLRSLNWVDGFDPTAAGVLFPGEELGSDLVPGTWLVTNAQTEDLVLLQGGTTVIAPYDQTDHHYPAIMWSKASALEPLHGTWREYLDSFGIDNWEFDYGKGLVLTWANSTDPGSTLDMSFNVPRDGAYNLSTRFLENVKGGQFEILVDGSSVATVDTNSTANEFSWSTVGPLQLSSGLHSLTLRNLNGLNAVNLMMLTDQGTWDSNLAKTEKVLSASTTVYQSEAEKDFTPDNGGALFVIDDGAFSQGQALRLFQGGEVSRELEIFQDGDYQVAVGAVGGLSVQIDGQNLSVDRASFGVSYPGTVHLTAGRHLITVKGTAGAGSTFDSLWLYSGQNATLDQLLAGRGTGQVTALDTSDPTSYRFELNATGPTLVVTGIVYDQEWVAAANGQDHRSLPAYSFLNGFMINGTGSQAVEVHYKTQSWLYLGAALSIVGTLMAVPLLVLIDRRRKRVGMKK